MLTYEGHAHQANPLPYWHGACLQARYPNHAILRSSIIYGPLPPLHPVSRSLFLQFVDGVLAAQVPNFQTFVLWSASSAGGKFSNSLFASWMSMWA